MATSGLKAPRYSAKKSPVLFVREILRMFLNRIDAGKRLAQALWAYKGQSLVVYALPRGGVVVAAEVAQALDAPLDLILVRKIGHPLSSEYAIGAVTEDGDIVSSPEETNQLDPDWVAAAARGEMAEARRRRALYLKGFEPIDVRNKIAIIVDDGIATGFTMRAAILHLRKRQPRKIVAAIPVAASDTMSRIRDEVDDVVVVTIPKVGFEAVGSFYRNFEQVSDDEVIAIMESSRGLRHSTS